MEYFKQQGHPSIHLQMRIIFVQNLNEIGKTMSTTRGYTIIHTQIGLHNVLKKKHKKRVLLGPESYCDSELNSSLCLYGRSLQHEQGNIY